MVKKLDLIIIRGPPGVGKSTVSRLLRDRIGKAVLFDVDYICGMFGEHPKNKEPRFKAHRIAKLISSKLNNYSVIVERAFGFQEDIDDILKLFGKDKYRVYVFTLESSLNSLIKKDSGRPSRLRLGEKVIRLLHERFKGSDVKDKGVVIKVGNKSPKKVVDEIMSFV